MGRINLAHNVVAHLVRDFLDGGLGAAEWMPRHIEREIRTQAMLYDIKQAHVPTMLGDALEFYHRQLEKVVREIERLKDIEDKLCHATPGPTKSETPSPEEPH